MRIGPCFLLLIVALALAACGDGASTASTSAAPASSAASIQPSQAASDSASAHATDNAGSAALDCAALEALMPTSIGDASISTTCLSGEEIMQAAGSVPLDELQAAGVELEDAAIAIGTGTGNSAGVFLYSLPGADTDAFRDQMAEGLAQVLQDPFEATSVGGKHVLKGEGAAGVAATYYLYVADDLLAWVLAPDDQTAAEVLSGLP